MGTPLNPTSHMETGPDRLPKEFSSPETKRMQKRTNLPRCLVSCVNPALDPKGWSLLKSL